MMIAKLAPAVLDCARRPASRRRGPIRLGPAQQPPVGPPRSAASLLPAHGNLLGVRPPSRSWCRRDCSGRSSPTASPVRDPDGTLVHNTTQGRLHVTCAGEPPSPWRYRRRGRWWRSVHPSPTHIRSPLPVGLSIRLPRRRRAYYSRLRPQERGGHASCSPDRSNTVDILSQRLSPRWWCRSHQGAPGFPRLRTHPFLVVPAFA